MTEYSSEIRKCLSSLDVQGMRRLWAIIFPCMPQPESDEEVLASIHIARTQTICLPDLARFYSHRWCLDHNLPSHLPDRLKPRAERIYPKEVSGVGISINYRSSLMKPIAPYVRKAMEDAVSEVYADGQESDIKLLKDRMSEARQGVIKKLLGIFSQ